ncbi:MAG: hypothetical protein WCK03_03220 [Candidatus Taylorbacteria bacterium]
MISLDECRKIQSELAEMSDAEVTKIRELMYGLGQLVFETWNEEKSDSKNPLGSLTDSTEVK